QPPHSVHPPRPLHDALPICAPAREHGHPDIEAVRSCTVCPPGAATAPRSSRTIAPHSVKGLTVEHTDRTHRLHTSAPLRRTCDLCPAAPYRPGGPCRHRRDRCPLRQRGLLPARRTLRPLGGARGRTSAPPLPPRPGPVPLLRRAGGRRGRHRGEPVLDR